MKSLTVNLRGGDESQGLVGTETGEWRAWQGLRLGVGWGIVWEAEEPAWWGLWVRPWVSLEKRKKCVGRRSGGKKCCNCRERVKSVFEVEGRALLKRFWGAKEPGRGEEVSAAREGRRSCSSWGWFQSPSNRDPIALQPPQQYHSYSHSCLKLSSFSPNPLLWLHSERATPPCLACSNHSNHMHPRPRTSLLPPPGISSHLQPSPCGLLCFPAAT